MKCPRCENTQVTLTTPDYGYGYGAEFACYRCDPYGYRFSDHSAEGRAVSDASRATSRANAEALRGTPTPYECTKQNPCGNCAVCWD